VYHLYHNVLQNRQYGSRYRLLDKYVHSSSCIENIIKKNEDGVYEWKESIRDSLNEDVLNYFQRRVDDEVHHRT
jgi:hypothetical protein